MKEKKNPKPKLYSESIFFYY